jgi:tetratricopeptide (TPR) repeat protein
VSTTPGGPGWRIDADTLLPVITDLDELSAGLAGDPCADVIVALWSGDPERAERIVDGLLADDPANPRLLALQADCWRDRGDHERARRQLERLVEAFAGSEREAVLVQHLGKTLFVAARYAEAAACFERALRLRQGSGDRDELIDSSRLALDRARTLAGAPDNVAAT